MRQLPETPTDQQPARSPFNGCNRKPHVGWLCRLVKTGKDAFDLAGAFRRHPPPVSFLVEELETFVAEADDNSNSVTCH
jgi:hypothetical protein